MRIAWLLQLGWRLAVGGGRASIGRLALMSLGVGAAAFLLIAGAAVVGARERHDDRLLGVQPVIADPSQTTAPPDHLEFGYGQTAFRGQTVGRVFVRAVGDAPPVPPGLDRVPAPGELAASPALEALLASPEGLLLRPRFPGEVTQVIHTEALESPRQLFGYVGVASRDQLGRSAETVIGFGAEQPPEIRETPFEEIAEDPVFQVILLVSVGLLIPISVFVAVAARTGAAAREARLAAIRLVGGTPRQVRIVVAIESLIAAGAGCLIGGAVFLVTRPLLARLGSFGVVLRAEDLLPSFTWILLIVLGVPSLALAVSLVALRRVVLTPLGVVRHAGRVTHARWRVTVLATGLCLFVVVMLVADWLLDSDRTMLAYAVVFSAFGCTAIGAAVLAPIAGARLASGLARVAGGPSVLIGTRRLRSDPRSSGRIVAALAVVIFAVGVTHAYTLVYEAANRGSAPGRSLRSSTVLMDRDTPFMQDDRDRLAAVPGVTALAPVWTGEIRRDGEWVGDVAIAPCADLIAIVQPPPSCGEAPLFTGTPTPIAPGDPLTVRAHDGLAGDGRHVFEITPGRVVTRPLDIGAYAELFVPLEAVPAGVAARMRSTLMLVGTDGRPDTVEHIRNELPGPEEAFVSTTPRWRAQNRDQVGSTVTAGVEAGTLLAFLVVAATIIVATVDGVGERRRSLASLAALGTSTSVLRRALVIETAFPLLAAVVLATASSMAATWMLMHAVGGRLLVPWESLGRVSLYAIVATALVTVGSFPSLGRALDPSVLSRE